MSGTVPEKRFPTWAYVFWFVVIILITCWPIFAFIAAIVMEPMYDCTRGITSLTCASGPEGIGSLIDNLGLMVWIFVVTGPIAILLLGIWLGVLLVHLMNRAGRKRTTA